MLRRVSPSYVPDVARNEDRIGRKPQPSRHKTSVTNSDNKTPMMIVTLLYGKGRRMRQILTLALGLAAVNVARAENFVFDTGAARLVIGSDGMATSLIDKTNGKEQLQRLPFSALRKSGQTFPASAITKQGALFHVTFGTSDVSADYRITSSADYLLVELTQLQGSGVEEIKLLQLAAPLANVGGMLGVRWNDEFAICLMGLSQQVDSRIAGPTVSASVYPEFSMQEQRVALIAVPTPRFLDVVQKVEHDFQLPSPRIGGTWAKLSADARTSYLFTDLTEANADETIRYAKIGGFRYILIYSGTWSTSLGSYPINLKTFPHGEAGLKSVIDKCHAAGLKVGMHMLTSLVGKNDPLVRPKPDPGLLKDGETTLGTAMNEKQTELQATSALGASVQGDASEQGDASDIEIDSEILHCGRADGAKFLQCQRGFAGTSSGPHKAGARIEHLAEREGEYLANLRSPLADAISNRISGVINRAGFDMIYFDGGETNSADGPAWYWTGVQQFQIWAQSKRDLLVQGSGTTDWSWHIFARGTCDDYAAVAVKQHFDYHKIADARSFYRDNFLPAELGWVGFLQDTPDHPATTPDELEYYAVRMLALDSPVSLETNLDALKANGRSTEMLELLGEYEQLRLGGAVPQAVHQQLAQGEWHMTRPGEFHPIRYDAQRAAIPSEITLKNEFEEQPLKFRLQVVPNLANPGDPANILLLKSQRPVEIPPPSSKDAMPGALIQRVELSEAVQEQESVFMVGARDRTAGKALDLTKHRALAVRLEVDGPTPTTGGSPVLNLQLETGDKTYRDYYVDLDFSGTKTVFLPDPGTNRMLAEFRPAYSNYPFKAAMYIFNYGNVVALNLRWMRYPLGKGLRCRVTLVEALAERETALKQVELSTGNATIAIPGEMTTGNYAEYWGDGPIRVFDANGALLRTVPASRGPELKAGQNRLLLRAAGQGTVKLTAITMGE
jgi:hypothetical protein